MSQNNREQLTKHMGLIPRQPTVEELGWGNSPFPIPAFSLQPFAFSLFLTPLNLAYSYSVIYSKIKSYFQHVFIP